MKLYTERLPSHDVIDQEVRLWKVRDNFVLADERQIFLASSMKGCDKGRFLNLLLLLKIGCALVVTSCECERSFSTLTKLKTWLRYSMTKNFQPWPKWIFIVARKLILRSLSKKFYHYIQENITAAIWFLIWMYPELYLLNSFTLGAKVYLESTQHLICSASWH